MSKVNSQFYNLVPEGWFKDYLDVMVGMNNEMPLPFHFLAAAVVLGQGLGFKCYGKLDKGVRIYPNVNSILLSPAGKCRRGEGTKFAAKVARLAGLNVHEGAATAEGLFEELRDENNPAGQGNVLLYVEELSVMLSKASYMQTMIPLLTKGLLNSGGPIEHRLKGQGKLVIPRCNLSALFTTAPDWFLTTMPEEAYGGGLMSRFIPCYLDSREVTHVDPNADDSDDEAFAKLARELLLLLKNAPKGHVKMTPDAAKFFVDWYAGNEKKEVLDARMEPHRNRAPANVVRMAMLLSLAAGESTITLGKLKSAIALLDWMAPTVWAMYGFTDQAKTKVSKGENVIITSLMRHGELIDGKREFRHSEMMRRCLSRFEGKKALQEIIWGLVEKDLVGVKYKPGQHPGSWPPYSWFLNKTEEVDG